MDRPSIMRIQKPGSARTSSVRSRARRNLQVVSITAWIGKWSLKPFLVSFLNGFGRPLPLEAMITPPGQARPMEFGQLHIRSEIVNATHIGLCLLAAFAVCWPAAVAGGDDGAPK